MINIKISTTIYPRIAGGGGGGIGTRHPAQALRAESVARQPDRAARGHHSEVPLWIYRHHGSSMHRMTPRLEENALKVVDKVFGGAGALIRPPRLRRQSPAHIARLKVLAVVASRAVSWHLRPGRSGRAEAERAAGATDRE